MHRTLRWAAGTLAAGVVLVVAAHGAGAAAGTSSPEPSCDLVRQQSEALASRYETASSRTQAYVQMSMRRSERTGEPFTHAQDAAVDRLERTGAEAALQLSAVTLGSPRCFDAADVEIARQSVQQLAPRLAGV